MRIQRAKHETVLEAGRDVGVLVSAYHDETGTTYFLKPAGHRFRDTKNGTLCAHGYQAFFGALFAREEGAAITTSIARYRGKEEFDRARQSDLRRAITLFPQECECE